MKKPYFLFAILISVLFYTGCKSDDDPQPQPQPTPLTYTVSYTLNIFGGYDTLQLSYFAPQNIKQFKINPKSPWNQVIYNYFVLDSIGMNATLYPLSNRMLTYEWEVKVTKGGELINLVSDGASLSTGENPEPILLEWLGRIE